MAIKTYKRTSAGRRNSNVLIRDEVTHVGPEKSLLRPLHKHGGRNNSGMITTRHEAHAERLRMLRLHGLSTDAWRRYATKSYVPSELLALGFKYNLTDLQAAIGIHQLAKLERHQRRREELALRFDAAMASIEVVQVQPRTIPGHDVRHALHLYLLLLDVDRLRASRNEIVAALREEGIGAAIHYRALHLEPYFIERFGHPREAFPHAAAAHRERHG